MYKIHEELFSGDKAVHKGLSNEQELIQHRPEDFKSENDWSHYASSLLFEYPDTKSWQWKHDDENLKKQQLGCLDHLMTSSKTSHHDKLAVGGWMLSIILIAAPLCL
ncbi:MAG: hypothetical protein LR008_00515 [Candidatus Pacebacteria bacterium]|nr:hypothetical protein [Candidatus Paceibacterota bacterium]